MKSELDHLPQSKQQELARIQRILLEEFERAIANATQPHKRNGKVYEMEMDASHATLETTTYYPDYLDTDLCYSGMGRTESVILTASIKERHGGKYGRTKRID